MSEQSRDLAPPDAGEISWSVHPAAEQRGRTLAVVAVLAVAALLTFRVSGSALLGATALLVLLLSVRAWFLPRRYVLDRRGASESGPLCRTRRLDWTMVRRVQAARAGIHLSPRHAESRLLPDRGLFLRTAANNAAVLAAVQAWTARQGSAA